MSEDRTKPGEVAAQYSPILEHAMANLGCDSIDSCPDWVLFRGYWRPPGKTPHHPPEPFRVRLVRSDAITAEATRRARVEELEWVLQTLYPEPEKDPYGKGLLAFRARLAELTQEQSDAE